MNSTISIGMQDFGKLIRSGAFYVDKTSFIKEWWENQDDVTLITRPRRFGKTLNLSMVDYFFSNQHGDSGKLFEKHRKRWHLRYLNYVPAGVCIQRINGYQTFRKRGIIKEMIVRRRWIWQKL